MLREGFSFGAPGFRAEPHDYGKFIEHQGGIFDEHGVGEMWFLRQREDARAEFFERSLVLMMLLARPDEIDGLAGHERQFAFGHSGTDFAGDGGKHRPEVYTRYAPAERRAPPQELLRRKPGFVA